jgi:hypothetical protein
MNALPSKAIFQYTTVNTPLLMDIFNYTETLWVV